MKAVKRSLAILLCGILLAAFAPLAHAEDTLIREVYATYTVPQAEEPMDFDAITVPLGARYTAKIASVYYYDSSTGKYAHIQNGDALQAGMRYSVHIRFYADSGYTLKDGETVYTVNGEVTSTLVGANMIETYFVAAKTAPDDPTPAKPTFRDRVAAFFQNMLNRFLFFIFLLRNLFGIKK